MSPELGAFLRARRDAIAPARAGIEPFPGPRRVPGLRRDELAVLAGVSPDYYRRIEQGRQDTVSTDVLDALARALRLDATEAAHLRDLADPAPARPASSHAPARPDPGLLRVLDTLAHVPVLLLDHRGDVLARNALLEAVLGRPFEAGTSFLRYLFADALARERIVNRDVFAQAAVATLRREVGRHPHDMDLRRRIEELRAADPQVQRWWDDHGVRDYASVTKLIRDPQAGDLRFAIEILTSPAEPDQRLVVYTVEPGSQTERVLPLLASWAAPART